MADNDDTRAGAVSGVAAGILVIALTAMAFLAFQPAAQLRTSGFEGPSGFVSQR